MTSKMRQVRVGPEEGRRREPRLLPGNMVHAHPVDSLLRVLELRNLSLGGFSIETDGEISPGLEKRFEFQAMNGLSVVASAVAVHCRRDESSRGWISGWRFVVDPDAERGVHALVDFLTSTLQFDEDQAS